MKTARGTSARYWAARLKRDHPDVAARSPRREVMRLVAAVRPVLDPELDQLRRAIDRALILALCAGGIAAAAFLPDLPPPP